MVFAMLREQNKIQENSGGKLSVGDPHTEMVLQIGKVGSEALKDFLNCYLGEFTDIDVRLSDPRDRDETNRTDNYWFREHEEDEICHTDI
jgi:hypothetical protein